jgi:hypothetical protein
MLDIDPASSIDFDCQTTDAVYEADKKDWILAHGSPTLREAYLSQYTCNDGYLKERIAEEFPNFTISELEYTKIDTPTELELAACLRFPGAVASKWAMYPGLSYLVVENYLGRYRLAKYIDLLPQYSESLPDLDPPKAKPVCFSSCLMFANSLAGFAIVLTIFNSLLPCFLQYRDLVLFTSPSQLSIGLVRELLSIVKTDSSLDR